MNYPQIIEHWKAFAVAIGGVALILLSVFLSIDGVYATSRWQAVDGTVTRAKIPSRAKMPYRRHNLPIFEYQYHVADKPYISQSIDVGLFSWLLRFGSISAVKNNPVGSQLKVYYDPHDPNRAALFTGVPLEVSVEAPIGLTMIIGAWLYIRERQRARDLLEEHFQLSWPSIGSGRR